MEHTYEYEVTLFKHCRDTETYKIDVESPSLRKAYNTVKKALPESFVVTIVRKAPVKAYIVTVDPHSEHAYTYIVESRSYADVVSTTRAKHNSYEINTL